MVGLVEPLHEQPHGGHMVAMVQQNVNHLGVGLGGLEPFDMTAPERDIASRLPSGAPFGQRVRHVCRRLPTLLPQHFGQVFHRMGGKLVPVLRQGAKAIRQQLRQVGLAANGRFTNRP